MPLATCGLLKTVPAHGMECQTVTNAGTPTFTILHFLSQKYSTVGGKEVGRRTLTCPATPGTWGVAPALFHYGAGWAEHGEVPGRTQVTQCQLCVQLGKAACPPLTFRVQDSRHPWKWFSTQPVESVLEAATRSMDFHGDSPDTRAHAKPSKPQEPLKECSPTPTPKGKARPCLAQGLPYCPEDLDRPRGRGWGRMAHRCCSVGLQRVLNVMNLEVSYDNLNFWLLAAIRRTWCCWGQPHGTSG